MGEHYHWKEHWTTAVHVICHVSLGLYDREWSWELQGQLLNHPSSPSRCINCPSPWLTIRLRSWAPEYQYGPDSARTPETIYKANRIGSSPYGRQTRRRQEDQCKQSKKMLCSTKWHIDSLQSCWDLEQLYLTRLSPVLALVREGSRWVYRRPSVGGQEKKKKRNPLVFIIPTVLRDIWVKEKKAEGGLWGVTVWLLLLPSYETWSLSSESMTEHLSLNRLVLSGGSNFVWWRAFCLMVE